MANEFKHKSVGTQMTQGEYEAVGGHVLDSQAAGDLVYASSTTQLSRLGIGTAGKVLAVNSGATAPEWAAAITGITSVLNTSLVIGRDADNDIDFATDNTILFRANGADQIKLTDGALTPVTDDDVDLGSSSLQFKDGYFDGTLEADAITVGGTAVLTGGAVTSITSVLNTSLVVGRDADNDIDFGTDNNIIFRAEGADQIKLIDGALVPVTDNDVDLGTSSLEFKDAFFDGTVTADAFAGPLTGNASTATALATARAINGVDFDGTAAITVTAAGSTLSDTVPVNKGGTNATSFADKAVLITQDSGTDTVAAAAMSTNGQLLIGGTSGPAVATLTAGTGISISNSDGGITVTNSVSDTTYTAGTLLDLDSTTFNVDLSEAAAATMAAADEFIILDNDDSSVAKRESLQDVLDTVAGTVGTTGLDRSGATLVVSDLHPVGVDGSANQLLTDDGDGTVTSESNLTFDGSTLTVSGDISLPKQKVIKIGGSTEAHDFGDEHSGHGITVTMEAGAGLTEGKAVYVDSNGKAQHPDVDHSSVTGKPAIGIAMSSVSSGATVQILTLGIYHDDTYSFSAGSPIIITGSSGALTTTASDTAADGDIVQRMGVAIAANTAFIMPSIDEIEHAGS